MAHTTGDPAPTLSGAVECFRLYFEQSPDAMMLLDPAGPTLVACNPAAAKAIGLDREELKGRLPADFAPEFQPNGERSGAVLEAVIRLTLDRGSYRFEWQGRSAAGRSGLYDVVATSLPLPLPGGTLVQMAARTITPGHLDEVGNHLSQSRWQRVFEQSPLSMQLFAPDGSSRQVNRAFRELFQLDEEDLKGFSIRRDQQLEAAGILPLVEQAFSGQVVTIPPIPFELRALPDQPARGLRWIGSTMFPIMDSRHQVIEVVCIHQDHTAREEAEAEVRLLNQSLEQRIAERTSELRTSEERFKRLFEFSPLGIGLVDEEGRFQQTNSAFAEMLGYTTEELSALTYWDITHAKFFAGQQTFIDKLRETGRFGPFEKEYVKKDGSTVPVMLNGMRVISSTGEVQIWGIAEDITQRQQAELALRESEEKFKALFELSPLGMARVSWDGRFLQVNQSFARMIGYTPEEVINLSYWDVTPRKYEEQEMEILEIVRATGRFGPFEKEYIHREGHLVPIVLNGMQVRGAHGRDELWGIAVDVTERNRAERALRESERKFRTLFEISSQGVMLHEDELFSEVNPAAARIFGLSPEEVVGTHPADYATEFQPDGEASSVAAVRYMRECMEHGTTTFEWTQRHHQGHEVLMEVTLIRIPDAERNLLQAVVSDISERKRAETELKRALERERELNQLKSNFVSMVSHEFRTPLGIIQSSAEILDDYLDRLAPAERREQLESIIKNSRRMAGLMEDVLLLGRFDVGRMEFLPGPLDPAALCRRLVDEVISTTAARCPIQFFTSNLPAEADADERLLRHILLNLLSNAVKYSEEGDAITFHASGTAESVEFMIRDSGIGIPGDELDKLFEAFQRGSNVGQRPGTGLGLMIVKQSVELHGGTIEVESGLGSGTTVHVTIPLDSPLPSS